VNACGPDFSLNWAKRNFWSFVGLPTLISFLNCTIALGLSPLAAYLSNSTLSSSAAFFVLAKCQADVRRGLPRALVGGVLFQYLHVLRQGFLLLALLQYSSPLFPAVFGCLPYEPIVRFLC